MADKKLQAKTSNNKNNPNNEGTNKDERSLPKDTVVRDLIIGIFLILFGVLFALGLFGGAGMAGTGFKRGAQSLLGYGAFLLPIGLLGAGANLVRKREIFPNILQIIGVFGFSLSGLGLLHMINANEKAGGFIGFVVSEPLIYLFERVASILILFVVLVVGGILIFDYHPSLRAFGVSWWGRFLNLFKKRHETKVVSDIDYDESETLEIGENTKIIEPMAAVLTEGENKADSKYEYRDQMGDFVITETKKPHRSTGGYTPPPISLLDADRGRAQVGDVKANSNIIRRTLMDFGIEVEMDEITIGPTFTRYAMKPAQGVKISRIVGLQNDLSLALAAHPVRVEAPIPGKSLVGIEIPNKSKSTVSIGTLMSDELFHDVAYKAMEKSELLSAFDDLALN